ncbi:zinc ribbon domain-containing protein [Methanolapillus millepedarum]|uniref:Putative zinc ribbon domain-containing protein n=1 Tax=Methanolapillus millepedarum TaxID=3028296 RepID=A0AA96V5J6_9EURY|nr:hypothetical protein MsAc7_09800 [Methanosarcinaceae archaeon Ac7]
MEEKYCQSCGMPMGKTDELYGTEKSGSKSKDYCLYCYESGQFTANVSMDEMIEICVPHMANADSGMTAEEARKMMQQFFPMLKRWQ